MMAIQRRDSYVTAKTIMDHMLLPVDVPRYHDAAAVARPASSSAPRRPDRDAQYASLPASCNDIMRATAHQLNEHRLHSCGWFYPRMGREHAKSVLERLPVGHFLLRVSSVSTHRYTLSVRVGDGVVSIRIGQHEDRCGLTLYHLDCSRKLVDKAPETATCVVSLIERLVSLPSLSHYQFTDNTGQVIGLQLRRPALSQPHSLTHLCRMKINTCLRKGGGSQNPVGVLASLPLPTRVGKYILEYPYAL